MNAEKKWGAVNLQDMEIAASEDYSGEKLQFAVFCIENVAVRLHVDASVIYDAFTKQSDILDGYIIPCYDALHTQGKDYIVNDLVDLMTEKGVSIRKEF